MFHHFPPFDNSATSMPSSAAPSPTSPMLNALLLRYLQQQTKTSNWGQIPMAANGGTFDHHPFPTMATTAFQAHPPVENSSSTINESAMFAKSVDSLHSFLSPNVILLPVSFHHLADEQHIQMLGMPQTVIPIAIHPSMHNQFPVRPLFVEHSLMASTQQQPASLAKNIELVATNGRQQLDAPFQLPISFRPSFHMLQPKQQQQTVAENCLGKGEQHKGPTSSSPINSTQKPSMVTCNNPIIVNNGGGEGAEPLDLSTTTRKGSGNGAEGTQQQQQQRRKRTHHKRQEEPEGGKKARNGTAMDEKCTSPTAVTGSSSALITVGSIPPSSSSTSTLLVPLISSVTSITPSSSSLLPIAANQKPAAVPNTLSTDAPPRKQYPCDLCGDVSFLALETLIGHKKYYCRNRPRPDPDAAVDSSSSTTIKSLAISSTALQPSSSSKKIPSTPSTPSSSSFHCSHPQCSFQSSTQELLAQHLRQQHLPPFALCSDCGFQAYTSRGLRTHIKTSHNNSTTTVRGGKDAIDGEEENGFKTNESEEKEAIAPSAEIKQEK